MQSSLCFAITLCAWDFNNIRCCDSQAEICDTNRANFASGDLSLAMLLSPASVKVSWNPVLITIGIGILLAIVSSLVVTSQWGKPTNTVATAGFFGMFFGILFFAEAASAFR